MKRAAYTIINILTVAALLTPTVFVAAESPLEQVLGGLGVTAGRADISTGNEEDPTAELAAIAGTVINLAFGLIAMIFVVVVMLGGVRWMQAAGSEEKIGEAKKLILNGVFGLTFVFVSYTLVFLIFLKTAQSIGDVSAPTAQ